MLSQEQRQSQESNAREGIMVVSQAGDGFRVFAATDPTKLYEVGGSPEAPVCNCTEFQWRRNQPGYRCIHIQAVFRELGGGNGSAEDTFRELPVPVADGPADPVNVAGGGANALEPMAQMTLKRSVSPDGRIDSFSVEFTQDLTGLTTQSAVAEAASVIALQGQIIKSFLGQGQPGNGNGNGNGRAKPVHEASGDGSVPAQMADIGGMNTRWGWRYFINVRVNGNTVKLFGTRKDLGDYLVAAGHPEQSSNIAKGVALNVPCRVIVKPTDDGKYLNVERVLPAQLPANYQERGH